MHIFVKLNCFNSKNTARLQLQCYTMLKCAIQYHYYEYNLNTDSLSYRR